MRELSRFSHLPWIARNARVTGDDRWAVSVENQIKSWAEQNPYAGTVNWSGIEAGIRVVNWILSRSLIPDKQAERMDKVLVPQLLLHAKYLATHLSRHSSGNNHLLAELMGLVWISHVLDHPWVGEWRTRAPEMLTLELNRQVSVEGFSREQSTHYHAFAAEIFLLSFWIMRVRGTDVCKQAWSRLRLMVEFLAELHGRNEHVVELGDGDDGHVIRCVQDQEFCLYRTLFTSAAVIYHEASFLSYVQYCDERCYLLFGEKGREVFEDLKNQNRGETRKDEQGVRIYEDTGLTIFKNSKATLVYDTGPLGYLSIAAHGHADALSVLLSVDGFWYFVDAGTYTYFDPKWRSYFRGTSAHNTVRISERDQSVSGGRMMWVKHGNATVKDCQIAESPYTVSASHDGYQKQGMHATHTRTVQFDPTAHKFTIEDVIETKSKRTVELYFHLNPAVRKIAREEDCLRVFGSQGNSIQLVGEHCGFFQVIEGDENTLLGWYSPSYDVKVPCKTLYYRTECHKTLNLITGIVY